MPITLDVTIAPPADDPQIRDAELIEAPGGVLRAPTFGIPIQIPIGTGANQTTPPNPITVTRQLGVEAYIPQEALAGTGISSIESGTVFAAQSLGDWPVFASIASGTIVNVAALPVDADTNPTAYVLDLDALGLTLASGVAYVVSMTDTAVTLRGADGNSLSATLADAPPDAAHEYVGTFIAEPTTSTVTLHPKLSLTLAATAAGASGVVQGTAYSVRLTWGAQQSTYDLIDRKGEITAPGITVVNTAPEGTRPASGTLFFGSVIGGASTMTLWSVPIFASLTPAQFTADGAIAANAGTLTAGAVVTGIPSYQLQLSDSSLYIYSNIDIDTGVVGSTPADDVYLASVVINSAPDDATSAAFAPSALLMGLVRPIAMGGAQKYAFVPEDDSVLIGGVRYLLSVIDLDDLGVDPNSRPYPPAYWPEARYWQFANRHNPYVDVSYEGDTQDDRVARAQTDVARIGLGLSAVSEPMHMYLDTDGRKMTVWPIYAFPFTTSTQTIDQGRLTGLTSTILGLLKDSALLGEAGTKAGAVEAGAVQGSGTGVRHITNLEQVDVPGELVQTTPYITAVTEADVSPLSDGGTDDGIGGSSGGAVLGAQTFVPKVQGTAVTNLNPLPSHWGVPTTIGALKSTTARQAEQSAAALSSAKNLIVDLPVIQSIDDAGTGGAGSSAYRGRRVQPVYGFSVWNPGSGEAYIVEVVEADLTLPDRLPDATANADYDPYYVRVVFLNSLTAYNMSIIVPTVAYDQFGYFARESTPYENVLSKTDELDLGYLYSLYDGSNNFDDLRFMPYSQDANNSANSGAISEPSGTPGETPVVFSNLPYSTQQTAVFNPASLFEFVTLDTPAAHASAAESVVVPVTAPASPAMPWASRARAEAAALAVTDAGLLTERTLDMASILFRQPPAPPPYFVCRRENWSTDCHLMQATVPTGTSIYLAFGAGDIVPFRLDKDVIVDKRLPTHLNKLTYTFADRMYDAVKTISLGNTPYVVAVTTQGGVAGYSSFAIEATAGTTDLSVAASTPLTFPTECLVVGQATTTLTSVADLNTRLGTAFGSTGDFVSVDAAGVVTAEFAVIPYNNLVYLVRAVTNVDALGALGASGSGVAGGSGSRSGLLIDTFVPSTAGNLTLAQSARYKRSGLSFFGASYTPTTMVDSLDNLDFTSITGETFYAPTIFVPIPEIDASTGFVADLSEFLGEQFWTFIYTEVVAQHGQTVNGVAYPNGLNLDPEGRPVLSLQKLQFVYDPIAVLFTPNDLSHKYPLAPKQQVLALTNGQVREGIAWRSADVQPERRAPQNVRAQELIPAGPGMDAANIVYSAHNRPVSTPTRRGYLGMSVHGIRSVSAAVYRIEESAFSSDQTATGFVSAVSSNANMVLGVLFDYDNNELGTLQSYDADQVNSGLVFLNGYLGASGYAFSSPDHLDVDDVLPSQLPLLEQIAGTMGGNWDVSFYNTDVSLPRQYWSFSYDARTGPGLPNFLADTPPAQADPSYLNRTRSLLLNLQNQVRPKELGMMDTYSSVVSANLTLANGVTGAIFLSKKADRAVASIGSTPVGSATLYGLPSKYDFFLFSRDHYGTLDDAQFQLIDQGYAMVLADDGSGTGTKVAKFYVDADGNYFELYSYVLFSAAAGVIESSTFTLKVALGSPANPSTTPATPETPNNVNPQDLLAQINAVSSVLYAAFGASSPGQAPAYLPIQVADGSVQAGTIMRAPGFGGYPLNVIAANHQPVQVAQLYSGGSAYAIAGTTTTVPINAARQKPIPFYGSLSHGLDKQVSYPSLHSADGSVQVPRTTAPQTVTSGLFGGDGLGGLIGSALSFVFQGSGAIPPQTAADPTPGTTMKADDTAFYTVNAVTLGAMDSTGKAASAAGTQYFVDTTDPNAPIYGLVNLPKFTIKGNNYAVNLATTLPDGVTSRYSVVVGGKTYLFGPDNAHVTVDRTAFTFNPIAGGAYTVTYASVDAPAVAEAPTPIALTPFSIVAGGGLATIDVFTHPDGLLDVALGVLGRLYSYDPVAGVVTVSGAAAGGAGATTTGCPLLTGLGFASASSFAYVIGINDGEYTVNGQRTARYNASTTGTPSSYPLMTAPQMFTLGGDFYTFDVAANGAYTSVNGNGQTVPINPYQFSINGQIYIINTNVQPNVVIGGGNTIPMTDGNTQFLIDGAPYTVSLKSNSLLGAAVSGQFDIVQGNVVVIEDYVYQLDTLNDQIVGNGATYPLTTSGFTYTITTTDRSFTVTTEQNATTVLIGGIDYQILDTSVVGDGVTSPILQYRSFTDGGATFDIGFDGTATTATTFPLSGTAPFVGSTFTDAGTFTVNEPAAFDGTAYFAMSGSPAAFSASGRTYTVRTDGVSIAAGATKTYLGGLGAPSPTQFTFGAETIHFGRPADLAAYDGMHYFAIAGGQFTDTATGLTFTLEGNTAVNGGNSYEVFSNLGATAYFQVPSGSTYEVNVPVADTGSASGDEFSVFPITSGGFAMPVEYVLTVTGSDVSVAAVTFAGGPTVVPTLTAAAGSLTGGYFVDPVTGVTYTVVRDGAQLTVIDSTNTTYPFPAAGTTNGFIASVVVATGVSLAVDDEAALAIYPILNNQFTTPTATYSVNIPVAYENAAGPYWPVVNGRFIVPSAAPLSNVTYSITGSAVTKGYVISADDQFTVDGSVFYTVDAVTMVRADQTGGGVVITYLPETTAYGFTAANGVTYLIRYSDVGVAFPVVSGFQVNAGVATVGADQFDVHVDEVVPLGGGAALPTNANSFEVNGNLYSITGTPSGADYSACSVAGGATPPVPFLTSNTFRLTDPAILYTLLLDAEDLPNSVTAAFPVKPSRDLITVADDVYLITYATTTTGSLLGQGRASIPIANSSFTLTNNLDGTKATFVFDDLDIYDAGSVVGRFTVYAAPTFSMGSITYTLDPVNRIVRDASKRPYPLLPNPTMFSIAGANYALDSNRVPHAVVGNHTVSPLSTDVTVLSGTEVPNSTFTLGGQIYKYVEDATRTLLAITGTRLYPIARPALTFKLDSSLIFTLSTTAPAVGNYAGTDVPIGTVTSGTTVLNVYTGRPESGGAAFFIYKNALYTLLESGSEPLAVQKTYTVYASSPTASQQQLAVFDAAGGTYLVTTGSTTGSATPAGINPGTLWAQTSISAVETQFGLVSGYGTAPIAVTETAQQSGIAVFQFPVTAPTGIAGGSTTTLYDVLYTAGGHTNLVQVDVPLALPSFWQARTFTFVPSAPLELETGGYNAFTTFVDETSTPAESFAAAFTTPIVSSDPTIDTMMTPHGDFSLEFWHSIPSTTPTAYHPVTFSASTPANPVHHLDVDFEDSSHIYVGINDTVLGATVTPPVFSSRWQHVALSYTQPYVMLCQGDGFEVKDGTNYNVTRDFSVAFTFAVSDVSTPQGLVYKGTGSDIPSPEWSSSYRVAVEDNRISLTIADAAGGTNKFLSEPAIDPDSFYEVVIVKQSASPLGHADSTDPYAPPFGKADLGNAASNGGSANVDPPIGSGSGAISITGVQPGGTSATNDLITSLSSDNSKQYTVTFAIRALVPNGTFGAWSMNTATQNVSGDPGLQVASTGGAHLLLGSAYDDNGQKMALGSTAHPANLRDVYLFGSAIDHTGVSTGSGTVPISRASVAELTNASIAGYWRAAYDPDGIVDNPVNQNDVAVSTNARTAALVPLTGHEYEGARLYVNGYLMNLGPLNLSDVPASVSTYQPGSSSLVFDAGRYKLQEISVWRMARQAYQVIDDMFGRLVPTNEPDLILYLSGSFVVQNVGHPILPLNSYIDHIAVDNEVATLPLVFSSASLDLSGSPAVGRCGPLITPNLYTPPGAALTVCDAPPSLTTYSVTVNDVTGTLAGEINEAYAYIKDNVLMLYAGKKIGDLVLSWVSQEQGDAQLIGYVEGAPPAPLANLTNKASYAGATSLTFTGATSIALKYAQADQTDTSNDVKLTGDLAAAANPITGATAVASATGAEFNIKVNISPLGVGVHSPAVAFTAGSEHGGAALNLSWTGSSGTTDTASNKLDESNRYTVKLQGSMAPYQGDLFMSSLNTVSTPSTTPGVAASKSPILPDPSTGGFTTSNPPGQLPRTPVTDERFGSRPFLPSPYGQAFVTSQTEDVYQQTLVQSNTVYGFVRIPNAQIPRDLNIVSFRLSSSYLRPGVLDGVVGYTYNPATLPTGAKTWTTSTGELQKLRDGNFTEGEIGHNASYMRVVEAYALKRQIDQEAFTALALYNTAYNPPDGGDRPSPNAPQLTPALDFYNEYVWTVRGGTQEVKHTYSTSYDEVVTTASGFKWSFSGSFDLKLMLFGVRALTLGAGYTYNHASTTRYSYTTTGGASFDIAASFDGIETDTQMRYAAANDAHFVMRNNSMYNPTNESGVNLVIGSDGLVYNLVPSVASGSGLPLSNDTDTSHEYTQPQPSYTTGNADGDSGALVPYDRPGKTKQFRTLAFFLQPARQNADDFWNQVIDPVWLANSADADAVAMRSAAGITSLPWRLLYRVTYSERFLPPVDAAAVVVPQITPLMAVPVLNPASDFMYQAVGGGAARPSHNPANDIEANLVLVAPTASGVSAGTVQTVGNNQGQPMPPNNVIPFDLLKLATPIVNWGDSANGKLLSQLITSALGQTTVPMSRTLLPGSSLVQAIADPVNGGVLYSTYIDPNGLTVNVPTNPAIQVFQDVNGNPVSYFDGKSHHSLQSDYVASTDGSIMYYIQPPSSYDQTAFDPLGDYDLLGHPGDEWRYYLVSGFSSDMTSDPTVTGSGPFLASSGVGSAFTGATIASAMHAAGGANQVDGYLLVKGILQWPNLNAAAETFADLVIYKSMSLLDTFPIGDLEVMRAFLAAEYPQSAFAGNDDISTVFARNIVSYFNTTQQGLTPQ